jgi:hypothetical protein
MYGLSQETGDAAAGGDGTEQRHQHTSFACCLQVRAHGGREVFDAKGVLVGRFVVRWKYCGTIL